MLVILNPNCDQGRGLKKWMRIASTLRGQYGNFDVEENTSTARLADRLRRAVLHGETRVAAAGGDGTVHWVLNAMVAIPGALDTVTLGAVGLGSSNDFHKPFSCRSMVRGIPLRMDEKNAIRQDLIRVRIRGVDGTVQNRYCLNNASIGITAQANAAYNEKAYLVGCIQPLTVEGAILAAALQTLISYRSPMVRMQMSDMPARFIRLTNLGIIKNPHFAGGLCYDAPIRPDDGRLAVCLCEAMNRWETVMTLVRLYGRRFSGRSKTSTWTTSDFTLGGRKPFALEMDGEVVQAAEARFEVLPRAVRCCV